MRNYANASRVTHKGPFFNLLYYVHSFYFIYLYFYFLIWSFE